jgi:hypothetical protein
MTAQSIIHILYGTIYKFQYTKNCIFNLYNILHNVYDVIYIPYMRKYGKYTK